MMTKAMKQLFNKLMQNQRYFWAFLVLIAMFLINRSFPAETITSESCEEGKCRNVIEDPSLSDEKLSFYINDAFDSNPNEYYRLTFEVRANQKTSVDAFITNVLDQDKKIGSFAIENPNINVVREIIFKSDKKYSDLFFKKENAEDGADVLIDQISLSKLNLGSDQDVAKLAPTFIGGMDMAVEDQTQTKNDYNFEQLKDPKVVFGQIFTPETDYITGVSLDIDIVKQSNNGGKGYDLELRDVDMESDAPIIKSNPIATLSFSVNDMERYRQENGKFLFPLLVRVQPGKEYFIGINNARINTDKFNYLIMKGTRENNAYPDGQLAVKFQKQSYTVTGSLYFKTYGSELKKYNGVAVLPGAIIEDLGQGKTQFLYKSLSNDNELNNLAFKTDDIQFDGDRKAVAGKISDASDSYFIYKFETVFPFSGFRVLGNQADPAWNEIKVSYSFDNQNWQEIFPFVQKDGNSQDYQKFNSQIAEKNLGQKAVYIKVEPQKDKYPSQDIFGLKDFEFRADLITAKK